MTSSTRKVVNGKAPTIGDDAVKAKTGKTWRQWFSILDKARARELKHAQIAAYLHETCGCPGWWSQMIAVTYEQTRGLRLKHEQPEGFQVSKSKTITAPVARLFQAWNDNEVRGKWLTGGKLTVSSATRNKYVRGGWSDGKTRIEVNFYPKSNGKSQVTVTHSKLPNARAAERTQDYWGTQLDKLRALLEK